MNELIAHSMISDKSSLDELTYLYMMGEIVTFNRIGSFLGHGLKLIHQMGDEAHLFAMDSNVRSLMARNGIDQLKLSIFLSITSYSLEKFESDSKMELDLMDCYDNFDMKSNLFKTFLVDVGKTSYSIFLEPTPCLNVTKFPNCKNYCKWHNFAVRNDSARNLIRYIIGIFQKISDSSSKKYPA